MLGSCCLSLGDWPLGARVGTFLKYPFRGPFLGLFTPAREKKKFVKFEKKVVVMIESSWKTLRSRLLHAQYVHCKADTGEIDLWPIKDL